MRARRALGIMGLVPTGPRRMSLALAALIALASAARPLPSAPPAAPAPAPREVDGRPATPLAYLALVDANADGRVDLAEYQAHMGRAFEAMDRDGDGIVAPHEFPPGVTARALPLAVHRERLAARFRAQDVDADGVLDAVELAAPPR